MIEKPFFVMIASNDSQWATPIMDDAGRVVFWRTESDAREAMAKFPLGSISFKLFSLEKPL